MDITKANEILEYWFPKEGKPDFSKWFTNSRQYDQEITEKFGDLLKEAEKGKGYGWLVNKDSFVAYIILMDQFSRHIYRDTQDAYKNDKGVLLFTELGFDLYKEDLAGYQFMFAFMPYMHTESQLYQGKGLQKFQDYKKQKNKELHLSLRANPLVIGTVSKLQKDLNVIKSMDSHVTGHHQTLQQFGRFPKRNQALGRSTTQQEYTYLNQEEVQQRPY